MACRDGKARTYGAVAIFTQLQSAIAEDGIDLRTATKCGPAVTKTVKQIVDDYFDKDSATVAITEGGNGN